MLIDPNHASIVANLGPIGFAGVIGIDFHPVTDVLFGNATGDCPLLTTLVGFGAGSVTPLGTNELRQTLGLALSCPGQEASDS